jgi:hypothetical protein
MQHKQPSRGFLPTHFWRDLALAGVVTAMGFMLASPGGPLADLPRVMVIAMGAAIFLAGGFWRINTELFAFLLMVFGANALFIGLASLFMMSGEGPSPWYLKVIAWLASTPVYPREGYPTNQWPLNLAIALILNAITWTWAISLVVAAVVAFVGRRSRRNRAPAERPSVTSPEVP